MNVILPQNKLELYLFISDLFAVIVAAFHFSKQDITDAVSLYVLFVTALSITITVIVKLYNIFTPNEKNKIL